MFHYSINRANQDERHTQIHDDRKSWDSFGLNFVPAASPMKLPCEDEKGENQAYLNTDRSQDQYLSYLGLGTCWVGSEGDSKGIECFHDHHDRSKNHKNSARRNRCFVRNIVKRSAEYMIISKFQEWSAVKRGKGLIGQTNIKRSWKKQTHGQM